MKRTYRKPGIYIENMTLSQSVASGCHMPDDQYMPNHAQGVCGWEISPGAIIWAADMSCTIEKDINIPVEGVCYNNPTENISLFSS